jgi:hypothetical protein
MRRKKRITKGEKYFTEYISHTMSSTISNSTNIG